MKKRRRRRRRTLFFLLFLSPLLSRAEREREREESLCLPRLFALPGRRIVPLGGGGGRVDVAADVPEIPCRWFALLMTWGGVGETGME